MNIQLRTGILWILIVLCYFIHGYYHLAGLFFGVDIKVPEAKGEVPLASHLFSIFIELLPLSAGLAALFVWKKWFLWASLIFAILLGVLNLIHLGATLIKEASDFRQLGLLVYIIVVNLLLIREIYTGKNQVRAQS